MVDAIHGMEDIVSGFTAVGDGLLPYLEARIRRETLVVLVLVPRRDEVGLAEVTVVEIAAQHQAVGLVVELSRADDHGALHVFIRAGLRELVGNDIVVEAVADVTAHAEMQVLDGIVVDAQHPRQMVGHPELVGRSGAVFHPVGVVEHVGVQGGNHHGFVTPAAELAPEADARLMPGARQDVELAFGTVASEELGGHVGFVGLSDRHHEVSHADVEAFAKRLLNPELLEGDLTATLDLMFELAGLLGLDLHGDFVAAMFKLDFRTHGPAFAKVIAKVDDHMGQVETAMALGIRIGLRMGIAVHVVAIEISRIDRLAVAADGQTLFFHKGVLSLQRIQYQYNTKQKSTCYQFRFHLVVF